jgi:nucleoside-triphosphatase THEP1
MVGSKSVILLTGKPRIGKTTIIKKIINEIGLDIFGGFYTEEVRDSKDRVGFKCVSISGEHVEIANVNSTSKTRIGRYGINVAKFEGFAIRILKEAIISKKIIVIDEIGFMQMLSKSFNNLVSEVISDKRIVLGTIPLEGDQVINNIRNLSEVKIVEISESNRDVIIEPIVKEIINVIELV